MNKKSSEKRSASPRTPLRRSSSPKANYGSSRRRSSSPKTPLRRSFSPEEYYNPESKNLYEENLSRFKTITFPKGTKIYRTAPVINKKPRYCPETGKTGLYFSTYPLQALAMCLEYGKSMNLGVFELKRPITLVVGKYTHRICGKEDRMCSCWFGLPVSPSKYIDDMKQEYNFSHFDPSMGCIIDDTYDELLSLPVCFGGLKNRPEDGEFFLSVYDLDAIKLVDEYYVPIEGLYDVIKRERYASNSKKYFQHIIKL